MSRLVLHIKEDNNWSFFIQKSNSNDNSFYVHGKQQITEHTIFNSHFFSANELGDYLEEVMDFKSSKNDFSITLFCYNLSTDATHSDLESYATQRRGELVKYYDVELTKSRCLKYLNFVITNTYITDK
jgi:hypothetical protein